MVGVVPSPIRTDSPSSSVPAPPPLLSPGEEEDSRLLRLAAHSESLFQIQPTRGTEGTIVKENIRTGRCFGILTSGGDAPGMNSAVRAAVRMGLHLGCQVFFIHEGYQGLVDGGKLIVEANWNLVSDIIQQGGTVIGSARCKDFQTREGRLKSVKNLIDRNIEGLICIGGDGTLTGADIFRTEWGDLVSELVERKEITQEVADSHKTIQIVGLVGSIDNDFCGTDMTIGTDTALHRIAEATDCVCSTAHSHQRAFVIEVMGRHCGYLALAASLAVEADFCFVPEWPQEKNWSEALCKKLKQMRDDGNRINIVVVAEGAIDCDKTPITAEMVRKAIITNLKYDTRITILGHVQRGGNPSAFDRMLGCRMGAEAAVALFDVEGNGEPCVITIDANEIVRLPLMKCVERTKAVQKAMAEKDWMTAVNLRGRSFRRNLEMYKSMSKIRRMVPKPADTPFNIAIVIIGSPASGLNAIVRSAVRTAILANCTPFCVENSIKGLADGRLKKMEWNEVSHWSSRGGCFLGTQRYLPTEEQLPKIVSTLENFGIHGMVIVGGFEAFQTSLIFSQNRSKYPRLGIPTCLVPCTIYNNMPATNFTIGSDTALNEICQMMDKIKECATGCKRRVFVVETMGDYCGYLATLSALAAGADAAYIFEEPFTISDLLQDIKTISAKMSSGPPRYIVVRSERASENYTSEFIKQLFGEEGKHAMSEPFSTRVNLLGHVQQGGCPSPFDRLMGSKMGAMATTHIIQLLKEGHGHDKQCEDAKTHATLLGIVAYENCATGIEKVAKEISAFEVAARGKGMRAITKTNAAGSSSQGKEDGGGSFMKASSAVGGPSHNLAAPSFDPEQLSRGLRSVRMPVSQVVLSTTSARATDEVTTAVTPPPREHVQQVAPEVPQTVPQVVVNNPAAAPAYGIPFPPPPCVTPSPMYPYWVQSSQPQVPSHMAAGGAPEFDNNMVSDTVYPSPFPCFSSGPNGTGNSDQRMYSPSWGYSGGPSMQGGRPVRPDGMGFHTYPRGGSESYPRGGFASYPRRGFDPYRGRGFGYNGWAPPGSDRWGAERRDWNGWADRGGGFGRGGFHSRYS